MSDKPISRQRAWQLKQEAAGKCRSCANPLDCESDGLCFKCLTSRRIEQRKKAGYKPHRKGSKGRKPYSKNKIDKVPAV